MISSTLKNDLLLKALRKELVPRPPVWMMRQAGRYMPEYQVLKKKYDFFTRVQTPELACEITLQPVNAIGVDAAILFSDILVIPQAMGMKVLMEEGHGPLLPSVIANEKDIAQLTENVIEELDYVFQAIVLTKKELGNKIPLIGFAGAPFTLLCYMVEGKGSKGFEKAKAFCFTHPALAHTLLTKITNSTISYLKAQAHAGVDVVQVFDSWSGLLSPTDFQQFSAPYLLKIAEELSFDVPVILFPKGSHYALQSLARQPAVSGIGLDWSLSPAQARLLAPADQVALQGNFDPSKLLLPPSEIKKEVTRMIDEFGTQSYIANLGHGILPHVPVDHARAFVDAVKEYDYAPA